MKAQQSGALGAAIGELFRDGVAAGLSDRELLARFAGGPGRSAEAAFAMLVARHGPMVLGVCRRILRDPIEADDAFQATFLVLARRAGEVRPEPSLGPWLHGVSRRVAGRLRSIAARRAGICREDDVLRSIPDRNGRGPEDVDLRLDLTEQLDTLPADFREPLVLCYLAGLTHEEAASRIGCPVGTVRSRLARGRALLRRRLGDRLAAVRRAAGPDTVLPDPGFELPIVPLSLIQDTTRAATRLAAGTTLAGVVPARVARVATGVLNAMYRTRLAAAAAFLALATMVGLGAWAGQAGSGPDGDASVKTAENPRENRAQPPAIALARAETGAGALQKGEAADTKEWPADFPAFVVEMSPRVGALDVDPATTTELRVTFSKPMLDGSWSWVTGNVYASPKDAGKVHFLKDKRTCVLPVKLEPGKTYVIGINGGQFNNFRDATGHASLPTTMVFRTKAAK